MTTNPAHGPSARSMVLVVAVGTLVAGCGGHAVPTRSSLDALGSRLAADGTAVARQVAGSDTVDATVTRRADRDVRCSGGRRREFAARFTAPASTAGSALANVESLATQVALKPLGYSLVTDVSGSVPATLRFENHPASPDRKRVFTTRVSRHGQSFTWTLRGQTACIEDS